MAQCSLARLATKRTKACDRRLHRLLSCCRRNVDISLNGFADNIFDISLHCHSDVDCARGFEASPSTSACYDALLGARTFMTIGASGQQEFVVPHSFPESEIVALEKAIKAEACKPRHHMQVASLNCRDVRFLYRLQRCGACHISLTICRCGAVLSMFTVSGRNIPEVQCFHARLAYAKQVLFTEPIQTFVSLC